MQLPKKSQSGVQTLGRVPTGAAMAASQAEIGEAKALGQLGQQAGRAVTEVADIAINRNVDKNLSKFSDFSAGIEADSKASEYTDASTLPQQVQDGITGGVFEEVPDGKGGMTRRAKMIPTVLVAPELNAYLRNQAAEEYSKDIGSDVHAEAYLRKTKEVINSQYVTDSSNKANELRRIHRSEILTSSKEKVQQGNVAGGIGQITATLAIPEDFKPEIIEKYKQQGMINKVDVLLQDGDMASMIQERDRLMDTEDRNNSEMYAETDDQSLRIQQRKRLDSAIKTRKAGASSKLNGEFKDWQAAVRDGNADPNNPQMKELGALIGKSGEWANTKAYGNITSEYGDASVTEAANLKAVGASGKKGRMDYRQKELDAKALEDAEAERQKELLDDDGDKASYIIKYNEPVSLAYDAFGAALIKGDPIESAGAWAEYTELTKANQVSKGVMPDNVKYVPENSPIIDYVKTAISKGSVSDRANATKRLTMMFGGNAGNVALEIADETPEFAGAVFTMNYDAVAAEQILAGVDVEHSISNSQFTDLFNEATGGVILGTGTKNIIASVNSHYLGSLTNDKDKVDSTQYEASIAALFGEKIEGYSSSGIPVMSYRMANGQFKTASDFKDAYEKINTNVLEAAGQPQMYIRGQRQSPQSVLEVGTLVQTSNGKYRITIPASSDQPLQSGAYLAASGFVQDEDGRPYELDFHEIDRTHQFMVRGLREQGDANDAIELRAENERVWTEAADRIERRKQRLGGGK